ncbi:MAG: 5-formyltetrahydrofolate cyclo-ligase [Nocardioidaceae bacterium]
MTSHQPPRVDKAELRARLLVRRRSMTADEQLKAGDEITDRLLRQPEVEEARTIAAYASVGAEPPTEGLLEALRGRGVTVLLPVLLLDLDLDWAEYDGPGSLAPGPHGLRQPESPRLGTAAVTEADVVLCPGLAVDRRGARLGRGGGSYDRVIARLPDDVWSCVVLFADEIMTGPVPQDPHDQRVRAAVTPESVVRFPA